MKRIIRYKNQASPIDLYSTSSQNATQETQVTLVPYDIKKSK